MNVPESLRPYPVMRNPYARTELWKSQEDLQDLINLSNENWYPKSRNNIYQQMDYVKDTEKIPHHEKWGI